jgi:peptidoglycan L-alanyl-D-glutamate endopeptidase CwlK
MLMDPRSEQNLAECHQDLQRLFRTVNQVFPCRIYEGHRPQDEQDMAVATGASKTPWPNSKHNPMPSEAVDAYPVPLNWKDRERFVFFAGVVLGAASVMGINIRWGGDWDGDRDLKDQTLYDLVHFEMVKPG